MYIISARTKFSAAHQLCGYEGPCEKLHGHNWFVRVEVKTPKLNSIGIGLDFRQLKAILEKVTDRLDHNLINDVEPFDHLNPSAENLARHFYQSIEPQLPEPVRMVSVTVWESEKYRVTYTGDDED
jgi:6-pyruvoyltetrahydropterin/6-carboxytetrahydropterin synthase